MVYVTFDPQTGQLLKSSATDPGAPGGTLAVRGLDLDFAAWTDDQWDASGQDVRADKRPAPKGDALLTQIAADVQAIRAKTDKL